MPPSGIYNVFELSTTSVVGISTSAVVGLSTTTSLSIASSTTAAVAQVLATSSGTVLQASNTNRKGLIVYSCSGSANTSGISYTTVAGTTTISVPLTPGSYWEMPVPLYTQAMGVATSTILGAGATATLFVTELS